MVPVDVEEIVIARIWAIFQHIHQHPILAIEGHVVGHNVLHPTDLMTFQHLIEHFEPFHATQFGIDGVCIHHVITVLTAVTRRENRRGVEIGYPQLGQIGSDGGGGIEVETRGKLQAISRDGNAHHGMILVFVIQVGTPAA